MNIEDFKKTHKPTLPPKQVNVKGKVWLTMLIEYDYITGDAKVLKTFSKPAQDSNVKGVGKTKKDDGIKLEMNKEVNKKSLF